MTRTVGLLSSYREGGLAAAAVASLRACCDTVLCLEGPAGATLEAGDPTVFTRERRRPQDVLVREGAWASDAAKRTELVAWAKRLYPGPLWGLVLDGDEALLFPELLPDYLDRADRQQAGPGGLRLKIVEPDGQVYESAARALRIDLVADYVLSGYQIRLEGSQTVVTLPLLPAEKPPIIGEPHILHRSYLRPPERNERALRLGARELDELEELKPAWLR